MSVSKKIILGVTGSIAAHKAADLASLLTKANGDVRVVMTADAQRFITPLPFKTLTRQPVVTDLYDEDEGWKPTHIALADEADLLLIAPATANVIAKLAHGIADDALSCIALALNPWAVIVPALLIALLTIGTNTFTDAVARVAIGVDRRPEEAALLDDIGPRGAA